MQKIVVVDDKKPGKTTVAYGLRQEVEELTNGECSAQLLEGEIITAAVPLIKQEIAAIRTKGDIVVGILVDLVDETRKITDAGAILLDKLKADPDQELRQLPVVIYTTRFTEVSVADLRKRGAKALVRRKTTGGRGGDLARQVLDAFGIPYGQGTNSTGPKDHE